MSGSTQHLAHRPPLPVKRRHVVGAGPILALVVLLLGSYGGGWSWTGFRANGTLWDWLHLLLLPLAVGTLPLWFGAFQERGRWWARRWLWFLIGLGLALLIVVVGGYLFSWTWTGFKGNTLWDWLELILVPVVLPLVMFWLTHRPPEPEPEPASATESG